VRARDAELAHTSGGTACSEPGEVSVRAAISRCLQRFSPISLQRSGLRAATVTIAVSRRGSAYGIWLTRRAAGMREHPGQYVLPGGRVEQGEDPIAAGLRELGEELGVDLSRDDVLGRLDDYVTRSGYVISAIVCWAASAQTADPNPDEVASVHFVSFNELLVRPRFVRIPESDRPVIQLPLLGLLIHAPTGAVLYQFAEVVLQGRDTRVSGFEEPLISWPER